MKRYLPLLANLTAELLFGFSYFFMHTGMEAIGKNAFHFLSFRYTLGFAVLAGMVLSGFRKINFKGRPLILVALCGVLNPIVNQFASTMATVNAPTSLIALYNAAVPVLILILSILLNKEYPTRRQVCFVLLIVAGLVVASRAKVSREELTLYGAIFIAISVLVLAFHRIVMRRISVYFSPFEIVYFNTGFGALVFSIAGFGGHIWSGAAVSRYFTVLSDPRLAAAVLYMGICSCVFAFLLMTYASANLPIAVFSSTSNFGTVVSISAGVLILHENFRVLHIVALVIIMTGIIGMSLSYDKRADNTYRAARGKKPKYRPR
ncbi:MAG: DMT family transporter [Treponema sp.]|jgi:drug/metabolite transporter (DMT)-like permease|nr:DMT family transporter [Treponema sp.]